MKDVHGEQRPEAIASPRPTRRELLSLGAGVAAGALMTIHSPSFAVGRGQGLVVETSDGKLAGHVENGVATFKGVPYAQSTAGRNRFLAPQPVKPWAGVREATRLGHPCVQTNEDYPEWNDPMPGSEDCLVLNVWAPHQTGPRTRLPVMVFIHGGGYSFGSAGAPLYDLANMARMGNVVGIGVNHRLHAFGFTDLSESSGGDFAASGNAGLLDIVAALQWIRKNVEQFGGDPDNVTLFGQSGGGAKISAIMAMPASAGLFHKVILESGSVFRYRERDEAAATTLRMASLLGIPKNDLRALQALPAGVLLKCADQIMAEAKGTGHPSLKYAPVVDGHYLPTRPWEAAIPPGARNIPMLLGTNRDETIIYLSDDARKGVSGDEAIAKAVVDSTPSYTPDQSRVEDLVPFYRKAMGQPLNLELVLQMSTDLTYWKGMVHQAELQSDSGAPVYSYRCDWRTPCYGAKWAPHGVELPFIMGHRHYGTAWDGHDTDLQRIAADPDNARFRVGDQMLAAWTSFARTGDPSTRGLPWPRYERDKRAMMIFDSQSKVVEDPHGEYRAPLLTA